MQTYIAAITGEIDTWATEVRANNRAEAVELIREVYPTQAMSKPILLDDARETANVMMQRMDADWENYHWVRETHSTEELIERYICPAEGDLEKALAEAKKTTALLDDCDVGY